MNQSELTITKLITFVNQCCKVENLLTNSYLLYNSTSICALHMPNTCQKIIFHIFCITNVKGRKRKILEEIRKNYTKLVHKIYDSFGLPTRSVS